MKIIVTLSMNGFNIPIVAKLALPDQYKHIPFKISTPIQLDCEVDLTIPTPKMENVYLLHEQDNFYKIGMSKSPDTRVKSLQTGNHRALKVVACCPGGKLFETRLHDMFQQRRIVDSPAKEWFRLSGEDVAQIKHIMLVKYFTSKFSEDNIINSGLISNIAKTEPTEYSPIKHAAVYPVTPIEHFPIKHSAVFPMTHIDYSPIESTAAYPVTHFDYSSTESTTAYPITTAKNIVEISTYTQNYKRLPTLILVPLPSQIISPDFSGLNPEKFLIALTTNQIQMGLKGEKTYTRENILFLLNSIGIRSIVRDYSIISNGHNYIVDLSSEDLSDDYLRNLLLCILKFGDDKPENCTCVQLKDALYVFGLSLKGNKAELISRFSRIFNNFSPFIYVDGLDFYSCEQLKLFLNFYKLSTSGNKSELIHRLSVRIASN